MPEVIERCSNSSYNDEMNTLSTIEITGKDAFDFLQNQLTNDLKHLKLMPKILAAWCNPKGRVIWLGEVSSANSGFNIEVPTDLAENIIQRFLAFRFRAQVEFNIIDENIPEKLGNLISKGQPFIGSEQTEKYTPHMLNLDLINAVDFKKGCYPGQEVVARIHYKGLSKRRTFKFKSESKIKTNDKVTCNGQNVGDVLNVYENNLLAIIPVKMATRDLAVKNSRLKIDHLPYFDEIINLE